MQKLPCMWARQTIHEVNDNEGKTITQAPEARNELAHRGSAGY
jgi:hypothetical protein